MGPIIVRKSIFFCFICSMAFTQTQLDALETAIAEGTLKVEYGDKKVEYRSLNEMIRIRDIMRSQLGQIANPRRTLGFYSKGIYPKNYGVEGSEFECDR